MKVAWLIQNLVPYHHARFKAVSSLEHIEGHLIQVTDKDVFSVLEYQPEARSYALHTLFKGRERNSISRQDMQNSLSAILAEIKPDCVCASGWGIDTGWLMQAWALSHHVPVVIFSESTAYDEPRSWWKEMIKATIVRSASAGVVGGTPHKEYISQLGMDPNAVFFGHNVVDNSHFFAPAPARPISLPEQLQFKKFFMACTRFGEKKNLPRLVRSYAAYVRRCKDEKREAFLLTIAGDGELRGEIEQAIAVEKMEDRVILLGAIAYGDLPWLYQNCQAFIHASTTEQWGLVVNEAMASGAPVLVSDRIGCAPDLVRNGFNGFLFDPFDEQDMTNTLWNFSVMLDNEKKLMGEKSQQIISDWSPERFANGLKQSINYAIESGPKLHRLAALAVLRIVLLRGNK